MRAERRMALVVGALLALGLGAGVSAAPATASSTRGPRAPRSVTLEWVGDIALSTQRGLPPGGVVGALAPVRRQLRDADVTLGNLEGTLSVGGISKCGGIGGGDCYAFQAPPHTAHGLHALGFDLVNQANNHAMDYGASGRAQTVRALNAAGIAHTGFPGQITYLRVRGERIAFLGFAPYAYAADLLDIPAARALVRRARRHASLVVVIIHAGAEGADQLHTPYGSQYFLGEDRGNARGFAHAVINAGASIVLGSGPHVVRGVEDYRGRIVAYSLGNFVGYHTLAGGGVLDDSGILRATLAPGGRVLAADWVPVTLRGGLPRLSRGDGDAPLVASLSRRDFAPDHFQIRRDGVFRVPGGAGSGGRRRLRPARGPRARPA